MGWKSRLRKLLEEKEPKGKLQDPQTHRKEPPRVDPLERIAALKAADWDLTIQLHRTSGGSGGASNKHWHITEVDPLTFFDQVSEHLGGGAYRMEFRKPDATLLRLDGSDTPERHTFSVAGKPKGEAKQKEKDKGFDLVHEITKEGSIIPMLAKVFFEQRDKSSEMVMELAKAALSGNGSKTDATALLSNVAETVVKLKDAASDSGGVDPMQYISSFMQLLNQYNTSMRPPVSATGSNSSGLDKFFESLGQAAPALVPLIAGGLGSKPTEPTAAGPALPANVPDNVVSMPQSTEPPTQEMAAFAGAGEAPSASSPASPAEAAPNPMAAFSAPDLAGGSELGPDAAAFGAIMKLRYMVGQEADPLDIASEMVDSINLLKGARRVEGAWQNFITDPGEAFDQFAPLIQEWAEKPEYKTKCREAMVKAVTEYFDGADDEDHSTDGADVETDNSTGTEEPALQMDAEAPVGDAAGQTDGHEGEARDGKIDG